MSLSTSDFRNDRETCAVINDSERNVVLQHLLKSGVDSGMKEFKDLTDQHTSNTYAFLSGLINDQVMYGSNEKCMKVCATSLLLAKSKGLSNSLLYDFSIDVITKIAHGEIESTKMLKDTYPDFIKHWKLMFGSVVIDNERVESGFSAFTTNTTYKQRKNRDKMMILTHTDPAIWYSKIFQNPYYQQYEEYFKQAVAASKTKLCKKRFCGICVNFRNLDCYKRTTSQILLP